MANPLASLQFSDPSFSLEKTGSYRLIIQLAFDSCCFLVFDTVNDKYIAFEEISFEKKNRSTAADLNNYIENLKEIFQQKNLAKASYKKISVVVENRATTLMPSSLFIESNAREYLEFNHQIREPQNIRFDYLNNLDAYNIFGLPQQIEDTLQNFFEDYQIVHHASVLIESLLIRYKNNHDPGRVFVNVRSGFMDIMVCADNKLQFFNIFEFNAKEDFIYFLLFVTEQLKLNPEDLELLLMGDIEFSSDLHQLLYQYIRNISFIDRTDQAAYSYVFNDLPGHRHYSLLNITSCGL